MINIGGGSSMDTADACAPGNPRPATVADFEIMFRKLM